MELTKEYIREGNKLLARFRGYEYIPFNNKECLKSGWWKKGITKDIQVRESISVKINSPKFLCSNHNGLRYYNNWNWIMGVVDEIERLQEDYFVVIEYISCSIEDTNQEIIILESEDDKLKSVFVACVEFVKWYNEDN